MRLRSVRLPASSGAGWLQAVAVAVVAVMVVVVVVHWVLQGRPQPTVQQVQQVQQVLQVLQSGGA